MAFRCLEQIIPDKSPDAISHFIIQTSDDVETAWTLAAFCPWENIPDIKAENGKPKPKPKNTPFILLAAREGLRATKKMCDIIAASHAHRSEILDFKRATCSGQAFANQRDTLGMAIRKWEGNGNHWRLQLLYALLTEAMEVLEELPSNSPQGISPPS
jgi:hypothetical protein